MAELQKGKWTGSWRESAGHSRRWWAVAELVQQLDQMQPDANRGSLSKNINVYKFSVLCGESWRRRATKAHLYTVLAVSSFLTTHSRTYWNHRLFRFFSFLKIQIVYFFSLFSFTVVFWNVWGGMPAETLLIKSPQIFEVRNLTVLCYKFSIW